MYSDTGSTVIITQEEWVKICEAMRKVLHQETDIIMDYLQGTTDEVDYILASKEVLNSFYGWSATSLDLVGVVTKALGKYEVKERG